MDVVEALAHQVRGMTIMYFLLWSCNLYKSRKENRLLGMLFISTIALTVGFLKDSVFLVDSLQECRCVINLVGMIDIMVMLVVCAFFSEAVKPGSTKRKRVWTMHALMFLLVVLYLVLGTDRIALIAQIAGLLMAVIIVSYVIFYAVKHRKYLSDNYSYNENISVRWVVVSCVSYILLVVVYPLAFRHFYWINEVIYCLLCILLWVYVARTAIRHKIVPCQAEDNPSSPVHEEEIQDQDKPDNISYITEIVAQKMADCMENRKIYLNPLLSIQTLATEIGSNTKYVSLYLNHTLGVTFYDYINEYRVREVCHIIDGMFENDRVINMAEVASQAGFNSVSSFNRYFRKVKGMTPKEYFKQVSVGKIGSVVADKSNQNV